MITANGADPVCISESLHEVVTRPSYVGKDGYSSVGCRIAIGTSWIDSKGRNAFQQNSAKARLELTQVNYCLIKQALRLLRAPL